MYYLYFSLLYHKLDVYQGDMQVSYLPNFASNYRYNKNTTCLILLYRLLRTNWTCLLVEYASQLQILFASFYWYNKIYYSLKFVVSYACLLAEYASQHQIMPAPYQWYNKLYLPILLYRLLRTNWTCLLVEYASQLQILFASFYWYNKIYYSLKLVVSHACLLAEYASQHQIMPAPYQWYNKLYLPNLSTFVVSPFEDELNLFARWVCLAASDLVRFLLLI